MFFYSVTFGGFVGLASSLPIYFNDQYGLSPVAAGYFTAACVFMGSLFRPLGGALADRIGGIKTLSFMYVFAAAALVAVSFALPQVWQAATIFMAGMTALGMGNGAIFQLVPQCFRREIGVMTGLVGMTGGFTTLDRAAEVEGFFAEHPAPSAARTVQQSLERIRQSAAWLDKNRAPLAAWFAAR